jgi:hypothetical protein
VDAGAELTVDHFQPRSQGGSDALDNLVYCCHGCNEFKGDYWQPDSPRCILHPLRDDIAAHIALTDEDTLRSLTPTGEFHIRKLHLNRSELILHRREQRLIEAERATQQATLDRLLLLEHRIEILQTQVADNQTQSE